MNELQQNLLALFKRLKQILDENNIPYTAIGGTAIGAFREKGFIEWDDDIDIGIHEDKIKDFQKAIDATELSRWDHNVKKRQYSLERVYDNSIRTSNKRDLDIGLYIDVFPLLRERKKTDWLRFRFRFAAFFLHARRSSLKMFRKRHGVGVMLGYSIIKVLPYTHNFALKWVDRRLRKGKKLGGEYNDVYIYNSSYQGSGVHCKYSLDDLEEMKFEDTTIKVSKRFPEYAKETFGDIFIPVKEPNHEHQIISKEKKD